MVRRQEAVLKIQEKDVRMETVRTVEKEDPSEKDVRMETARMVERDARMETVRTMEREDPSEAEKDARMEKEDHLEAEKDVRMVQTARAVIKEIQEAVLKAAEASAANAGTAARAA